MNTYGVVGFLFILGVCLFIIGSSWPRWAGARGVGAFFVACAALLLLLAMTGVVRFGVA